MKDKIRYAMYAAVILMFALAVMPAGAATGTITSANFSLGYGYVSGKIWNTSETAANNTATTIGNFSFSATPTSLYISNSGCGFTGRVLGTGTYASGVGYYSSAYNNFSAPITASYNGPAPVDAAATPNYRLIIDINSISIYVGAQTTSTVKIARWDEVTSGHLQASSAITIGSVGGSWSNVSHYDRLSWNPDDFSIAMAGVNNSVTRTFDILNTGSTTDKRFVEGFEVTGSVQLIYDKAGCGDLDHPYPAGDINHDCYVNFKDFATLASKWLYCNNPDAPCNYVLP
jgi:hypothetical protein